MQPELSLEEYEKDVLCLSLDGEENGEDDNFTPRGKNFGQ